MTDSSPMSGNKPRIDTTVPHSARIWNYFLGGKDNYPVDRAAGDQVMATFPQIVDIARADRAFLRRAVSFLVNEAGIRQFLDIGTGLPTLGNTHQVAQGLAPESRIVYVDNDPLVLVHARALLTSSREGACDYIDADVRQPGKILAEAAKTLDFRSPVAIMLLGTLGQIPDSDQPNSIVGQLLAGVPSGSYLVFGDGITDETYDSAISDYNESARNAYHLRSPEQITGFFDGLELVEPGVVSITRWRPEPAEGGEPRDVAAMAGVGRKP
jgi:hypothetical protein